MINYIRKTVDNFIIFNVYVEKGLLGPFSFILYLFAISKLHHSAYLCTPSGIPYGFSLLILPLFFLSPITRQSDNFRIALLYYGENYVKIDLTRLPH